YITTVALLAFTTRSLSAQITLQQPGGDKRELKALRAGAPVRIDGVLDDAVWQGMSAVKEAKLTDRLGLAPGPANGFTLDIIQCFERFSGLVDWAMVILGPLEPWPGKMLLPAAQKNNVKLITRVVDYGGLFHDDVKPGHQFGYGDHRTFRPAGWVEAGNEKLERMRPIAKRHGLTMLQLACLWNLSQPAVQCVIPTLIQEVGDTAKPIETKLDELAALGIEGRLANFKLSTDECREIEEIGNNQGCMDLKGGNPAHTGEPLPDRWSLTPDLVATGQRWGIEPRAYLVCTHPLSQARDETLPNTACLASCLHLLLSYGSLLRELRAVRRTPH
ncbi:MAG: hypothetical protein HC814_04565, partial [Rhodobacteraceae bacterium]|nr:hypothetical protein [Paracoccaceae bacterium]